MSKYGTSIPGTWYILELRHLVPYIRRSYRTRFALRPTTVLCIPVYFFRLLIPNDLFFGLSTYRISKWCYVYSTSYTICFVRSYNTNAFCFSFLFFFSFVRYRTVVRFSLDSIVRYPVTIITDIVIRTRDGDPKNVVSPLCLPTIFFCFWLLLYAPPH